MFDGMIGFYERTLDIALRFRFITLMVFLATVALTVVLYVIIPKGFFPTQDTGIIIGITDAAQDASFDADGTLQQPVEPGGAAGTRRCMSVVSAVGAGAGRPDRK